MSTKRTPKPVAEVRVTRYVVSCLPDGKGYGFFDITVEYRGRGLWAVVRHMSCLSRSGKWSYEPQVSSRTDAWLARHRFDLDTALELAKKAATKITVNGVTVQDKLDAIASGESDDPE